MSTPAGPADAGGRSSRVRVEWSLAVLALVVAGGGHVWMGIGAAVAKAPAPTPAGSALFALLVILGALVHEVGHALAGRACGHHLERLSLGLRPRVRLTGTPRTWRRTTISLAGPLAEGLLAAVLLAGTLEAGSTPWEAMATPGPLAGTLLGLNAISGTLPLGRRSDGWKAWRGLKELALSGTRRSEERSGPG